MLWIRDFLVPTDPDPRIRTTDLRIHPDSDPTPALDHAFFVNGLQDANKKYRKFFKPSFIAYYYSNVHLNSRNQGFSKFFAC